MFTGTWRRPIWACALWLSMAAHAQQGPLTLAAAIERSLADNPELKAFGYELSVQEGRIQQAGARPALELGATVEDLLGNEAHRGFEAAEATLTIGWVWERGVRAQRVAAAQANLTVLQSEAQVRRLDTAAETARCFLAVLTHQQELAELQRAFNLADETHTAVQARVAAAKAPEAEAARAYAQLARARLDLEHEEHELLTAGARLAAMWGQRVTDSEHTAVIVSGDLLTLPPLLDLAVLNARLQANPSLAHLLTTQRLREAELQLATAQRRPAWQVTAGVRRFEISDDQALVFGLAVPLPNRAHAQGAIAAARAQVEQSQAQSAVLNTQLNTELFAVYQEMKHAHTEADALRDEVLPRMETALSQARYAYERGRYSYMEWLATQREVTEVRRALIVASANAHRHRIEIEKLTGATVAASAPREVP
jgi:outer membrane protein, heavy metal efflux system